MSHGYRAKDRTWFNYNSDLSGTVEITVMSSPGQPSQSIKVSGSALLGFVANWMRDQQVSRVEQMNDHEILGIPKEDMPGSTLGGGGE